MEPSKLTVKPFTFLDGNKRRKTVNCVIEDKQKQFDATFHKGHTYLFEIIYKENLIVVDYGDFEGLILLHAYNQNGYEYKYEYLQLIANQLKFKLTTCYNDKYKTSKDSMTAQKIISKNE